MARNKFPQETRNKIIDVAIRLFIQNGYEATAVQDIINNLGGLSKGAIYHHFKSKEEIMMAAIDKLYEPIDQQWYDNIIGDNQLSGMEKLRLVTRQSLFARAQDDLFKMAPNFLKNPQMLAYLLRNNMAVMADLENLIEQGVEDGSIQSRYAKELVQVFILLTNIYLVPSFFYDTALNMKNRFYLCKELFEKMGLDVFDDETEKRLGELCLIYDQSKE